MDRSRSGDADRILRVGQFRPQLAPTGQGPYILEADAVESSVNLGAYWQILLRRRWTVVATLVIVTTLATVVTFRMTPVYRGTARVEIDPEVPELQSEAAGERQSTTDEGFLRSQAQVLQTDQLAWRTIEQLGLAGPHSLQFSRSSTHDGDKLRLIERFRDGLKIELVPQSRVIRVQFDSTDPQLAAAVPNSLVNNYIDYNFSEKYDAARQASRRMEQQLDELKAKVEKSQQALVDYQREHAIAKVNDNQNVVELTLGELSTDLTKAQADRIEKQAINSLLHADPSQIASVAQNDLLQKLQEKYADLSNQYTEALHQYGPNFPKVLRLRAQISDAESLIQKERNRIFAKIGDDYSAAARRENLLTSEVARKKEELGNINRLLVEQNILAGDFESNQKMYQTLLQRLKEATVSAGLRSTNVHLVDPALPPVNPIRPRKVEYVLAGMLTGLFFGVVLAFTQEAIDSSLKTADEAEDLIGVPALAMLPAASFAHSRKLLGRYAGRSQEQDPCLAMLHQPKSPLAESFRSLRTSVLYRTRQKRQTMLVTSPGAGDGKTCTAINLAIALGQGGQSIVLVDCDLRRSSVASTLGVDGRKGLTTLLMGRHTLDEVLFHVPELPHVSILPAGPAATNPSELLSSEMMGALIRELGEQFGYVILDTPPVLSVTDASVLSAFVDGILLIVAGGNTPRIAATSARHLLDLVGAPIIGVVVNKVQSHDGPSYRYYGRQYA